MDVRPNAAVIGEGISELTAAHGRATPHRVTLFAADTRLGGRAHTHHVPARDGRTPRSYSGFVVHNERTCSRGARKEAGV
jgi:predicted NAD/FAD-binding protein